MSAGRTVADVGDITSIDVPEVDRIGDAVLAVAGRLERVAAAVDGWEHAADDAVEGAEMCYSAAAYAAGSWRYTLADLAASVRQFGEQVHRAAAGYRQADASASGRVREAGF
jgi:hypothetical protein